MNKEQLQSELAWAILRDDTKLIQAIRRYLNFRCGSNKNRLVNSGLYDSGMLMHLTDAVERELRRTK